MTQRIGSIFKTSISSFGENPVMTDLTAVLRLVVLGMTGVRLGTVSLSAVFVALGRLGFFGRDRETPTDAPVTVDRDELVRHRFDPREESIGTFAISSFHVQQKKGGAAGSSGLFLVGVLETLFLGVSKASQGVLRAVPQQASGRRPKSYLIAEISQRWRASAGGNGGRPPPASPPACSSSCWRPRHPRRQTRLVEVSTSGLRVWPGLRRC